MRFPKKYKLLVTSTLNDNWKELYPSNTFKNIQKEIRKIYNDYVYVNGRENTSKSIKFIEVQLGNRKYKIEEIV